MTPLTDKEISAKVGKGHWHETLKTGQIHIVNYVHNDVPLGDAFSNHCDRVHLRIEHGAVQWMRETDLLQGVRSGTAPIWHNLTD